MNTWDVTKGYVPKENYTKLIPSIKLACQASHAELLAYPQLAGPHSLHPDYLEAGPLRECRTIRFLSEEMRPKFPETIAFLHSLIAVVDPDHTRKLSRGYTTILEPGKQIYLHSDTDGDYWRTINRYQFYFTGDDRMTQKISDTLFPVGPGLFYLFDHNQLHEYHNNSDQNLMLMVFDLQQRTS